MNLFSAIMMFSALFFVPLLTVTNIPNTKFGFEAYLVVILNAIYIHKKQKALSKVLLQCPESQQTSFCLVLPKVNFDGH